MFLTKESLYGNQKSKFILIKDSTANSGVKLFKAVAQLYSKEGINLHFIYYESITRGLHKVFDPKTMTRKNAVSDPCGWNNLDGAAMNLRSLDNFKKEVSEFKGVVCIDSLSPLLFYNKVGNLYRTLHKILKDNKNLQLIALLHDDVHDSYENEILEKLASTVLFVTPDEDKLLTTVRYASGKVSNQLVECKISDNLEFSTLRDVNLLIKSAPMKKPDPTANLTFNLKLKDNEIEARSQLVLPYTQMKNNNAIPMEDDMYDEDDPDDDLDI